MTRAGDIGRYPPRIVTAMKAMQRIAVFGDRSGGTFIAAVLFQREPLFAGDAIADPLTGITAALAACANWRQGGSRIRQILLYPRGTFARPARSGSPARHRYRRHIGRAQRAVKRMPPSSRIVSALK